MRVPSVGTTLIAATLAWQCSGVAANHLHDSHGSLWTEGVGAAAHHASQVLRDPWPAPQLLSTQATHSRKLRLFGVRSAASTVPGAIVIGSCARLDRGHCTLQMHRPLLRAHFDHAAPAPDTAGEGLCITDL